MASSLAELSQNEEPADDTLSTDQADLLAELLGDTAPVATPEQDALLSDILGEVPKMPASKDTQTINTVLNTINFELVVPNWNMGKLSRSFFAAFKLLEETCEKADQWVDQTQNMLERLVLDLPDKWPERDSTHVTSRLLGRFFAISQQYPVSQYLENFSSLPNLPETFPPTVDVRIPEEILEDKADESWWYRTWQQGQRSQRKIKELYSAEGHPTARVRLRGIGVYWLKYQHYLQRRGTLRDAGDFYFVFLKAIQRLFNLPKGADITGLREEMFRDVQQLADNLRSTHRSHLMYIYNGIERELWNAFYPWNNLKHSGRSVQRRIRKLEEEHQVHLSKYSEALEYVLEDFHIRLQFFQIQREAHHIMEGELKFIQRQYERFKKQLEQSMGDIRSVTPEHVQDWLDLNKYMFAFRMEKAESTFYETTSSLKNICKQINNNQRTNNLIRIFLDKYERVAQSLPEYANIIHLEKLWSWTHKKIEIDESVPLRFSVEQFFHTRLEEPMAGIHQRWLRNLHKWAGEIDQQEQFFRFSFYSLRQEWSDPLTGWQNADRVTLHKALEDSSTPTILQLQNILQELEHEFQRFHRQTHKLVTATIDDLEQVIFDPGVRQRLLRLASESSGIVGAILGFFLDVGHANVISRLPLVQQAVAGIERVQQRWLKIKASFQAKPPPIENPLPTYYTRVFVVEPLEISTLFVGRESELQQLRDICHNKSQKERAVIAVIGLPGSGKRSLIDYFIRNDINKAKVKIHLSLVNEQIVAIINNKSFSLDKMIRKVQLDRFDVVVLEGLESCFIETAGGAQLLQEFFEWLQKAPHEILWIVSINELAWRTIELLDEAGGTFTHFMHLHPVDPETIKEMLYRRHQVVGLSLKFKLPNHRFYRWLYKLRPKECDRLLEWQFFSELERRSQGNPAIAMKLWTSQCKLLDDNTVLVNPVFENVPLPHLEEEELLILRIILSQGNVGPHHLQTAVVSSKYLRVCLDNLKGCNLVSIRKQEAGTTFTINPEAYLLAYQLLQEAMLLP